ncbi:DUF2065 domain-containing protein [Oceanospirillum sediminis]|uniref:DUF2065 domain-containing protein n=1 Tax=Oceanospirillum sediminis TaxID=2760088 RepID=A0A839IJT5_9GAMM|nr:DUF2065 domain-containing protein [Oceanospirillum sediminis]MBB1485000.1 DUF2065 domain-containing protein [Oceanospirillum sediminis]
MNLDWQSLLTALCLVLVIEGAIPFANPGRWRKLVMMMAQVSDQQLRMMGLISMAIGLVLLYAI